RAVPRYQRGEQRDAGENASGNRETGQGGLGDDLRGTGAACIDERVVGGMNDNRLQYGDAGDEDEVHPEPLAEGENDAAPPHWLEADRASLDPVGATDRKMLQGKPAAVACR